MYSCSFWYCSRANLLLQNLQANFFFPEWVTECLFKANFVLYSLLHPGKEQVNCIPKSLFKFCIFNVDSNKYYFIIWIWTQLKYNQKGFWGFGVLGTPKPQNPKTPFKLLILKKNYINIINKYSKCLLIQKKGLKSGRFKYQLFDSCALCMSLYFCNYYLA